ncbi:hypothetical protein ACFO1B_03160 [Dactylosporangium siamense]|uniref:4-hydroxybenzoate polyprenyltransferase n=1 Tax=Dactylosporangium siamense TaxID=685454 RepID=A0A919U9Z7_9ACTN|nr:hypothetical protein [Dactylosporangium siamense]GIG43123.1 hypothetical protein Dsi01nite_011640 [Dactylosporangium siamense]
MRAFIRGSYPLVPSVLFAVCWAYGVTGLFALTGPPAGPWRPSPWTAVAALTIALDMLLMRIIDDIRDLPYDRVHNPHRPLATGAVTGSSLLRWYAGIAALLVLLNLFDAWAALVVAAQLAYALLLLLPGPDPGRLVLTLVLSSPVQLLLHLYLYTVLLHTTGGGFDPSFWTALAVVSLATLHLEVAKKITRAPRPGERTYVTTFGLPATVAVALLSATGSALLLAPWGSALTLLPLAFPAVAWWRFRRAERWDARLALLFVLASFATWALIAAGGTS